MSFPEPSFSEKDVERWIAMLNICRKRNQHIQVGIMHIFLKDLRFPQKVTKKDIQIMLKGLSKRRQNICGLYGDGLASLFSLMKSMDISFRVTEKDKEMMEREISVWRDIGDGERIAWHIYAARMFGVKTKINEWDKQAISHKLKQYRDWNLSYTDKFKGMRLAEMHFLSKSLKIKTPVRMTDIDNINWFIKNWKKIKHPKIDMAGAETNWYLQKINEM